MCTRLLSLATVISKQVTHAVKSAAPVAACVPSLFKQQPQTAPLCPTKLPIQSPVDPLCSIGLVSVRYPYLSQGKVQMVSPLEADMNLN